MVDILKVKVNNQWVGIPAIKGEPGEDGVGVPDGGTTGQVLAKASNTDYDTEWVTKTIPTKTSDLTNDSDFITSSYHDTTKYDASNPNGYITSSYHDDTKADTSSVLNKQQITNCILEAPQNINLTLSNGTLTLKAGSVVCVPNGFEQDGTTPKFNEVTIANDLTGTRTYNETGMVQWNGTSIEFYQAFYSGPTAPTPSSQWAMWYDTTNNIIKHTSDTGAIWSGQHSFPLGIYWSNTSGITGIDVFRRMGYIGSTVFVRKGLKVLVPDGRNADGSLKNIEYTTTQVKTNTLTYGNQDYYLSLDNYGNILYTAKTVTYYNNITNYTVDTYAGVTRSWCFVGSIKGDTNNKLSNFKPYTATNVLKYSDKSQISGFSMPSTRYTDLTIGASGTTYTAPANGYLNLCAYTSTNCYFALTYSNMHIVEFQTSNYGNASGIYPIKSGTTYTLFYDGVERWNEARFVYAEGN